MVTISLINKALELLNGKLKFICIAMYFFVVHLTSLVTSCMFITMPHVVVKSVILFACID